MFNYRDIYFKCDSNRKNKLPPAIPTAHNSELSLFSGE